MKHGFSLVELSIVLVILGLLTGGILAGQSLIRASELRTITAQVSTYQAAINTFRDKYFALPGDMVNATSFWGRADTGATTGQCADPDTNTGASPRTCNGNGNGRTYWGDTDAAGVIGESFHAWQHLANAGLVEGNYTGIPGAALAYHTNTTNTPSTKLGSNTGVFYSWVGEQVGGGGFYAGSYGHTFYIGGHVTNSATFGPILKPEELWNIDVKMDDGKPAYGIVNPFTSVLTPGCTNNDTMAAEYVLTATTKLCALIFRL